MLVAMVDLAGVAAAASLARAGEVLQGTVELSLSFLRPAVGAGTVLDRRTLRRRPRTRCDPWPS